MWKYGCSRLVHVVLFMVSTNLLFGSSQKLINRKILLGENARALAVSTSNQNYDEYAVVFDAGSTGSRVHVFRFGSNDLGLLPIGQGFEFYNKTTPGLSAYADNPNAAADSLKLLLQQAQTLIPTGQQPQTPVRLGATAGLRLLSGDTAERILEAVRELFKTESSLKYKSEWVSIIDGFQEGSYMWVAVNYLMENLGKPYPRTAGVVDLGGASVQMAYSISEENAANAPKSSTEEHYLVEWNLMGTKYYLYTHSYLRYGLEAARAQILKLSGDGGNPCIINGYQGTYEYSGEVYKVSTPPRGNNIHKCRSLTKKILNLDTFCPLKNCTFNGIWNGGGGDGQDNLYVATSFYYTAAAANIVGQTITSTQVCPTAYREAATIACNTNIDDIKIVFPYVRDDNLPFLCMDLLYEYTLLVNGFGIHRRRKITVVQKFVYKGSEFDAAWPLGCAVDLLSPPHSKLSLYRAASTSS